MADAFGLSRADGVLADGRAIHYYDPAGAPPRTPLRDGRPLGQPAEGDGAPQVRVDPWTGESVLLAGARQDRTFLPADDACPLCPSAPGRPTEIPDTAYDVVVFDNRFPSMAPPHGRCEVVVYTSDHAATWADLPAERARALLRVLADRTAALNAEPGVHQVFAFENRGIEIGVTLTHAHGQIYAYPFAPPILAVYVQRSTAHLAEVGRCLGCDQLAAERAAGARVVVDAPGATAYVPAAARWPYEVHVVPHRCAPDLPSLVEDPAAADAVADVWQEAVRRLDALHGSPMPLTACWVQAPSAQAPGGMGERPGVHTHLRLQPARRAPGKLKYLAGSETGAGVFALDVDPDDAARALREAGDGHAARG